MILFPKLVADVIRHTAGDFLLALLVSLQVPDLLLRYDLHSVRIKLCFLSITVTSRRYIGQRGQRAHDDHVHPHGRWGIALAKEHYSRTIFYQTDFFQ